MNRIVMIAAASLTSLIGLSSTTAADKDEKKEPIVLKTKAQLLDFVDNTKNYKGKLITLTLIYNEDKPLRQAVDPTARFNMLDFKCNSNNVRFDINIEAGFTKERFGDAEYKKVEDLPNAKKGDDLVVTFLCDKGSLLGFNFAKKIVRDK